MHFETPAQAINNLSFLIVCFYALWRGGSTERWGALFTFAAWFLSPIIQDQWILGGVQFKIFIIDATYFFSLLVLAMGSNRFWPLWAAGLQGLDVLMHVAMLIDHKVHARAYFIGVEVSSWCVLIALAIGTWLEAPRGRPAFLRRSSSREVGVTDPP